MQEALLHAVVGTNLLEDIPGELAVQLVGDAAHENGDDANDCGDGDQEGLAEQPHVLIIIVVLQGAVLQQILDGAVDLVDLEDGVNENG